MYARVLILGIFCSVTLQSVGLRLVTGNAGRSWMLSAEEGNVSNTISRQSEGHTILENDVCGNMGSIEKEFCFNVLGTNSRPIMNEYKSARNKCEWVPFKGSVVSWVSVPGTASQYGGTERTFINYNNTRPETCRKFLPDSNQLHIFRLGPYFSDGNNDKWYKFAMEDLMPDLNGKEVGVRGYLQAAVDVDGDLLGYPPLQLHHHHFSDLQCDMIGDALKLKAHHQSHSTLMRMFSRSGFPIWADTHTDKQCSVEAGGTDCLIRLFPQDYALPMKLQRSGCMFGDYMDVREPNSPHLTWWVESMVHIVTRNMKQYLGLQTVMHGKWNDYPDYDLSFPTGEFPIDLRNESVVWSSINFSFSGRAVLVQKHTHRLVTEDMLLLRGKPEVLGLPEMQFLNHENMLQRDVSPYLFQHKKQILERIQSLQSNGLAELVCAMHDQKNSLELVDGFWIDRMLPLPCVGWKFHENETFTLISFHKAQKNFRMPKDTNMIAMHNIFYVYGVPENMPKDPWDAMVNMEGVANEGLRYSQIVKST